VNIKGLVPIAVLFAAAVAPGCRASQGAQLGPPLPFHVAVAVTVTSRDEGQRTEPSGTSYGDNPAVYTAGTVIPPNVPDVTGTVTSWSVTPSLPAGLGIDAQTGIITGTPTVTAGQTTYTVRASKEDVDGSMRLALVSARLAQAVIEALDNPEGGSGFSQATLLKGSAGGTPSDRSLREEALREALENRADFILAVDVSYSPAITSSRNQSFWLNSVIQLFAGPLSFSLAGRRYAAAADLDATLRELTPDSVAVADGAAILPRSIRVTFETTDLSLSERAERKSTSYPITLLLPTGLVATESDYVAEQVSLKAVEQMLRSLKERLDARRGSIVLANNQGPFGIDEWTMDIQPNGDGGLNLAASIIEGKGCQGIAAFTIGSELDQCEPQMYDGTTKDAKGRCLLEATLPAEKVGNFVTLSIRDLQDHVRTYTFPSPQEG